MRNELVGDLLTPVNQLSGAATGVQSTEVSWSDKTYGEDWETIYPSARKLGLAYIKEKLDDNGKDFPTPNPYEMDYDQLVALLDGEGEYPEEEPGESLKGKRLKAAKVKLVPTLLAQVEKLFADDGSFLDEWADAYRDAVQEEPDAFAPMMNYYYEVPGLDLSEAEAGQAMLERFGGACILVELHGSPVLALSGGGMDMRWDICLAFMLLGYLPPVAFVNLPEFAGIELTPWREWVIDGCIEACEDQVRDATYARDRVKEYKARLQKAGKKSA